MDIGKLEDRILFDAGLIADAADLVMDAAEQEAQDTEANEAGSEPNNSVDDSAETADSLIPDAAADEDLAGGSIIIIDEGVENFESLVNGADPESTVYTIKSGDGIDQLVEILNSHTNIGEVHLVTHGNVGEIRLGSDLLNLDNIDSHAAELSTVSDNLTEGADLILYGCKVAADGDGRLFVNKFSDITQADIAASSDSTGNTLNANWQMEYSTGEIEADIPFTEESLLQLNGALATLTVGDLVVINQDLDFQEFRLMALSDISSGTVIKITDRGLDNSGSFVSSVTNEGTITWTLATAITAGETFEFTIVPSGVGGIDGSVSILEVGDNVNRTAEGSVSGWESFGFGTAGDQVIIYQGTDASPTFISGFHNSGNSSTHISNGDWQNPINTTTGSSLSHLPSGLTNETNALAFSKFDDAAFLLNQTTHQDNLAYNGPTTSADKATWLTRIFDRTNWVGSQSANQVGSISETAGNAGAELTVIVNTEPAISNLDGDSYTYTEGDGQTILDQGTALTLTDSDSSDFDGGNLTVTITSGEDAAEDILSVDTSGTVALAGVTIGSNVSVGGTVVGTLGNNIAAGEDFVVNFNSNATPARIQTLVQAVTYQNSDTDNPTTGSRNVRITVNDGDGGTSANQDITVTVQGENDDPTATGIPTDVTVAEDTASNVDFSAITFADVDSASITVTLTASDGTFSAPADGAAVGAGVTETLVSATVITLTGAPADISTYLDTASNIKYTGASNVNGNDAATITVTANDGDGSGNVSLGIVNIDITAVNDDPTATGIPTDVTVAEDTAGNVDFSAITFADVDSASITVTLTASDGTFSAPADGAAVGAGVTETLVSATVITLTGAPADISTYLDTASNIKYTGASNVNGNDAATITVTANDGDGSGNVNLGIVNIDITAVNDDPTATGIPTDVTVAEDTAGNVDFSAITFADVDSASITVTLTASDGTFSAPADGAAVGAGVTETLVSATVITLTGAPADISTYLDTASNIKYTGASNVNGNDAATITVTANDGDGSGNVNLGIVNIDITAVNDDPTATGIPTDVTVAEDTAGNIDFSAITFADVDSASITVTLTASDGTFSAPADGAAVGAGVTETLVSATVITLTGAPADISTYLDTASNIKYTGASNVNGNDAATITVTANDGDGSGNVNLGTVNIDITAANDAPTATGIPTDVTVTEDTTSNVDLSAVTFTDVDNDPLTVTLTATAGIFTAASAGGVTIGGSGTGALTLAGSAANINTFLDTVSNIQYTGASNVNGNDAASFTVKANDGNVNPTLGTVNIDITPVNDDPAATGVPTDVTVTEDTAGNIDFSAITFTDVDSASITVTLTASDGTFSAPADGAAVGAGVTETLVSATVITLTGAPADISTYLDTASNIKYTGASNVNGNDAATITVTANDGDGSGNVNLGTVNIDITAANDAPTATGIPTDVTVTEDTASNVDLSAVTFTDVDNDPLTVTLTATAGIFTAASAGGVTIGGSGTGALTLAGSAANINTFLDTVSNIQYTGASNVNGNDAASFTVKANDGNVNPTLGTVNIDITPVNDAPVILNLNGDSFTYNEGDGIQNIDQGAALTLTDVDSADFNGGNLTVTITSGEDAAEDILTIDTSGTVALSGITTGSDVSVGGVVVGTLGNNIAAGSDLVINLNTDATAARIQILAQALAYENSDTDNPTAGDRNVRVTVADGDTGTSANQDITITVAAVNDAPVITNLGGDTFSYTAGSGPIPIDQSGDAVLTDVDSADFNGGNLTVTVTDGADASEDILSLDTSGTVALAGTTAGSNVSVGGTAVGTLANNIDAGNDLVINLNANATPGLVQTLLQSLTYENSDTSDPTAGPKGISVTVNDGDGGTSLASSINGTIEGVVPVTESSSSLNSDQQGPPFLNTESGIISDTDNFTGEFIANNVTSSDFIFGSYEGSRYGSPQTPAYMNGEHGLSTAFSQFSDSDVNFSRLDGLTGELIQLPTLSFHFEKSLTQFLRN